MIPFTSPERPQGENVLQLRWEALQREPRKLLHAAQSLRIPDDVKVGIVGRIQEALESRKPFWHFEDVRELIDDIKEVGLEGALEFERQRRGLDESEEGED